MPKGTRPNGIASALKKTAIIKFRDAAVAAVESHLPGEAGRNVNEIALNLPYPVRIHANVHDF